MDTTLYPRRIAPLYGLVTGLMPMVAVLAEFWKRMNPLLGLAMLYCLGLLVYYTVREYRGEVRSGGHEGGHGAVRSAHLVMVAIFALAFFGLDPLLFSLATGHRRWQFAVGETVWQFPQLISPDQALLRDIVFYALALGLFAVVYWLAHRFPGVRFDFHLRWRWRWLDAAIILGLGVLTVGGLAGYMYFNAGSHGMLDMFGTRGGASPVLYWTGGIVFALANALMEELWFRGVLMGALRPLLPPARLIALQAVVFGLIHWFGTPRGVLGVLLAGAWGALLGWWVYKRGSLWPTVVVHFLADIVIFAYVN